MKPALIHWFRFLLALLLMSWFFASASCSRKPTTSSIEKDTLIVTNTKTVHFKNELQKSLAINDTFKFGFPKITTGATNVKDCDSLCNQKIKQALANVSTSKNSGSNGYKFYYDKFNNQFVLNVKQGETIKQYKDSVAILNNQLISKQNKKIEIPVDKPLSKMQLFFLYSGVSLWVLLVAVLGWKIYKIYNPLIKIV